MNATVKNIRFASVVPEFSTSGSLFRSFIVLSLVFAILEAAGGAAAGVVTATRDGRQIAAIPVEIAVSDEERGRGLMGRTELASGTGMWFDFGEARRVRMWMKNTLIPLDMVFVARSGHIVFIARDVQPRSRKLIGPDSKVLYVLELNAGDAQRLDLHKGDQLSLSEK